MKLIIKKSTSKEKKLMAIFKDNNGKTVKTTHFGQKGYQDYTQHKDKSRRDAYMKRHKKRENWNNPTTAGALSKFILWGPSTSRAVNIQKFKKRFKLK